MTDATDATGQIRPAGHQLLTSGVQLKLPAILLQDDAKQLKCC